MKRATHRCTVDGLDAGDDFSRNEDTVAVFHVLEEKHSEVEAVEQRIAAVALRMLWCYRLRRTTNNSNFS